MAEHGLPTHRRAPMAALLVLLLAMLQGWPAWAAGAIAVVTVARGSVTAKDGTQWKNAPLLHPLRTGDILRLAEGARATLGFVQGGVRVHLQGPCEVQVVAGGVRLLKGAASQVRRSEPPARAALRLPPGDSSLDRMGATHVRAAQAALDWVGVSEATIGPPTRLSWRSRSPRRWARFTVTVYKGLDQQVARIQVPGTETTAALPASAHLQEGVTYEAELEGILPDGTRVLSPRCTFRILAADEAADLRAAREEAELELKGDPRDPTPLVILLTRLDAAGLTQEALDVALRIERMQGTASPALATWIQQLREKLGQQDSPTSALPELLFQDGHRAAVNCLAFSPDGRLLASGAYDDSVRLWDLSSGQVISTLLPQAGVISAVAFAPDRATMAVGTVEGKVGTWEVNTGRRLRELPACQGEVGCLRFSPDGRLLALATSKGEVVVRDLASGREVLRTSRATGDEGREASAGANKGRDAGVGAGGPGGRGTGVGAAGSGGRGAGAGENGGRGGAFLADGHSLAFSPDGRSLAARTSADTTVIWDLASRHARVIRAGRGAGVQFVGPGRLLACGTALWDLAAQRTTMDLAPTTKGRHILFSPDGSLVAVADRERLRILDARSGRPRGDVPWNTGSRALAWSPDGRLVADARVYPPGQVVVRKVPSGEPALTLAARADLAASAVLDHSGRLLMVRGEQGHVTLWDLARGRPQDVPAPDGMAMTPMAPIPLPASHGSPPVFYWVDQYGERKDRRYQLHRRLWRLEVATGALSLVSSVAEPTATAATADGSLVAVGTAEGTVAILDGRHPAAPPRLIPLPPLGTVKSLAFSPDGRSLAVAGTMAGVLEVEVASGRIARTLPTTSLDYPVLVRYAPGGRLLAISRLRSGIWTWARGEAAPRRLPDPDPGVRWTLDFSPDGRLLATPRGHQLLIHDLERGGALRTMELGLDSSSVAFVTPQVLVTTGAGSLASLAFRRLDNGALLATAMAMDGGRNWVVTTPPGLFDGTADGQRSLEWRIGDRLYRLEQFFNDFYTPGLLPRVLTAAREGRQVEPTLDLARIKPPPRVRIVAPANGSRHTRRSLPVQVLVEDQGGGISQPRLYVNGHRVPESPGGTAERVHVFQAELAHGENLIRATAFNGEGKVESRNDRITVQAELPPPRVTLHVLAVGVSQYSCGLQVPSAGAGARTMAATFAPGLFAEVKTTCLVDRQATRAGILAALAGIEKQATPDDAVWIYLGGQAVQSGGDCWFLPWDARAQGEDDVQADGLSGAQLSEALTRIRASKQVLVLETATDIPRGTLARLSMRRDAIGTVRAQQRLARSSGTFLVSLPPGEGAGEGPGLLVQALATGLGAGGREPAAAVSREGQVTMNALLRYVSDRVARSGGRDVIQSGTGQDFPLRLASPRAGVRHP